MRLARAVSSSRTAIVLAAVALVYAAAALAQASGAFTIRLHRPASVGQRMRVTATGEQHQTLQLVQSGRVVRNDRRDTVVHWQAIERVLAVDAHGKATRSEYTVEQFQASGPNANAIHPGQVILVERAVPPARGSISVDGQPVNAALHEVLDPIISTTVGGVTDDDIFGTPQPQRVGASWPLHGDIASQDLATTGIHAVLTGQSHLLGHRTDAREDVLEVSAEMNGNVSALPNMPPGATLRAGVMNATFHGLFPVAPGRPAHASASRMHMQVEMDFVANNQPSQIRVNMEASKDEHFSMP